MNILSNQKQELAALIKTALKQLIVQENLQLAELPEVSLEIPKDKAHGDFASNIALVLAKPAGMKPRDLAEKIAALLRSHDVIE